MSLNINRLVQEMSQAAADEVAEGSGIIASNTNQILNEKKASLKELYEGFEAGHIDEEGLERELKRELKVMEIKLLTTSIMKKATAQRAVNAAVDTFMRSVGAVL